MLFLMTDLQINFLPKLFCLEYTILLITLSGKPRGAFASVFLCLYLVSEPRLHFGFFDLLQTALKQSAQFMLNSMPQQPPKMQQQACLSPQKPQGIPLPTASITNSSPWHLVFQRMAPC